MWTCELFKEKLLTKFIFSDKVLASSLEQGGILWSTYLLYFLKSLAKIEVIINISQNENENYIITSRIALGKPAGLFAALCGKVNAFQTSDLTFGSIKFSLGGVCTFDLHLQG